MTRADERDWHFHIQDLSFSQVGDAYDDAVHIPLKDAVATHFSNHCILPRLLSVIRLGVKHPVEHSVAELLVHFNV